MRMAVERVFVCESRLTNRFKAIRKDGELSPASRSFMFGLPSVKATAPPGPGRQVVVGIKLVARPLRLRWRISVLIKPLFNLK